MYMLDGTSTCACNNFIFWKMWIYYTHIPIEILNDFKNDLEHYAHDD